jgi:hypothetical protein
LYQQDRRERENMDNLIRAINVHPNGTTLIVKKAGKYEIKGEIDTIYETDNGEEDAENYQEFYSCLFLVQEVLNIYDEQTNIEVDSLIDITIQDPPNEICLETGEVIWKYC